MILRSLINYKNSFKNIKKFINYSGTGNILHFLSACVDRIEQSYSQLYCLMLRDITEISLNVLR